MNASASNTVSRRAALAGFGAVGAGLAVGARPSTAQDANVDMANHPIVGTWYFDFPTEDYGILVGYSSFHSDGTRADLHPFAGSGIGSWRPTGERTGESILKYQNIAIEPGAMVPGTVTAWGSLTLDQSGNEMAGEYVVELRGIDGTVVALFPATGPPARRLVVESPPPIPSPEAGTPTS